MVGQVKDITWELNVTILAYIQTAHATLRVLCCIADTTATPYPEYATLANVSEWWRLWASLLRVCSLPEINDSTELTMISWVSYPERIGIAAPTALREAEKRFTSDWQTTYRIPCSPLHLLVIQMHDALSNREEAEGINMKVGSSH